MIIQMSGVPGSGKSTLSRMFAKEINAIIIDHDIVKSPMVGDFAIKNNVPPNELGKIAYDIDFALADFYLSQGMNVIIDSPCFYDTLVEKGNKLAEKYNVKYKYIECFLDDITEINRRLQTRNKLPSQIHSVNSAHIGEDSFIKLIHGMKKPKGDYIVVKTNTPVEMYLPQVLEHLNS